MKKKPINILALHISIFLIVMLTFVSCAGAIVEEEGAGGQITLVLSYIHKVFLFPSYTLFGVFIYESHNFAIYLLAYTANCIFYGVVIERIYTLSFSRNQP